MQYPSTIYVNGLNESERNMANGEHIEVAKAYVTIVPSLEGSQGTITKELTGVTTEAGDKAGK